MQIIKALKIERLDAKRAVEKRLQAMHRDEQLQLDKRGRYTVVKDSIRVTARIQISRNQIATLVPEDVRYQSQYIVVSPKQARAVMNNDLVIARFTPNDKKKDYWCHH